MTVVHMFDRARNLAVNLTRQLMLRRVWLALLIDRIHLVDLPNNIPSQELILKAVHVASSCRSMQLDVHLVEYGVLNVIALGVLA